MKYKTRFWSSLIICAVGFSLLGVPEGITQTLFDTPNSGNGLKAQNVKATITNSSLIEDMYIQNAAGGYGNGVYGSWLKFNISNLAGLTITNAQLKLWGIYKDMNFDNDISTKRIANQTWTESNANYSHIAGMPATMNKTQTGMKISNDYYHSLDVTFIVQAEIDAGNTNSSFLIDDPDYPFTQNDALLIYGTPPQNGTDAVLWFGRAEVSYQTQAYVSSKEGTNAPYLEVSYLTPYTILAPTEDVFIQDLRMGDCAGYAAEALIKFNISTIPASKTIDNVIIRLNITTLGSTAIETKLFTNQTWTEADTTITRTGAYQELDTSSGLTEGINDIIVTNSFNYAYENSFSTATFSIVDLGDTIGETTPEDGLQSTFQFGGSPAQCEDTNTVQSFQSSIPPKLIITLAPSPAVESVTVTESTNDQNTLLVTIQPAKIVPYRNVGGFWDTDGSYTMDNNYGFAAMLEDDGDVGQMLSRDGGQTYWALEFESNYWNQTDELSYKLLASSYDATETIQIKDYHNGEDAIIEDLTAQEPEITGTHAIVGENWIGNRLMIQIRSFSCTDICRAQINVLTLNFTSFSESHLMERVYNGTQVLDMITIESKEPNTVFNVTGIPTTYTYSHMIGEEGTINDQVASGYVELTNTGTGFYLIYFQVNGDTTDIISTYPLETYLDPNDGVTELQRLIFEAPVANTNYSISGISTGYTLNNIYPLPTYTDTITASGIVTLTEVQKRTYTIILATGRTLHNLHTALNAADGTGLKWETFKVYANNTRMAYPPSYLIYSGTYVITVQDYYQELIATDSITILSTDPHDVFIQIRMDFYTFMVGNLDLQNYYILATRNGYTANYSLARYPSFASWYMYGAAVTIDYNLQFYTVAEDANVLNETLEMSNKGQSYSVDYLAGDHIEFTKGGGGSTINNDLIWTQIVPILIAFVVSQFFVYREIQKGRKAKKAKKKKSDPQRITATEESKRLKADIETSRDIH